MTVTAAELQVVFSASGVAETSRAIDQMDQKVKSSAAAVQAGGLALTGMATAAAIGFKTAIGVTADFDAQLSGIASVGGKEALERLDDIRATALRLGADTSFSASEAAQGMEEMIKAGLSVDSVLGGAAQSALDLAAASGTSVAESAEIMSTMLNVFGETMTEFATDAEKANHAANLLSQAANASATDVHQMGLAFAQAAATARGFGVSVDDLSVALAIMAQNGIKGSDAGTSLKQMLLSLTNMSKPTKEALKAIGLSSESFTGADGQFVGIEAMFDTLRTAMEAAGYSAMDVNNALAQIFGSDAGRAAQIFFRTQEDGWDAMRAGMDNAGTVQEAAAIRLDNLAGDLEQLSGAIETATITFASFATGPLRLLVQHGTRLVNMLSGLPPNVQQLMLIFGALATAIAGVAGGMALFGDKILLVIRGLAMLTPPMLAIAAAVGVLYLAWTQNWGGIQQITEQVVGGIGATLGRMQQFFQAAQQRGLNPFRLAFRTLIVSLGEALGPDHPVVEFLQQILRLGERLATAFQTGGLSAVVDELQNAARRLGRWGEEQLQNALSFGQDFLGNLLTSLQGVDWASIGDRIREGLSTVAQIYGNVHEIMRGLAGRAIEFLVQAFGAVDWSAVGSALMGGLQTAVSALRDLGLWVWQQISGIDWDYVKASLLSLAGTLGGWFNAGVRAGILALMELGGWVLEQLGKVDWSRPIEWLKGKGQEISDGLQRGIQEKSNEVGAWFQGLGDKIGGKLRNAGQWLVSNGREILGGLRDGAVAFWQDRLGPWLGGLKDLAIAKFVDAYQWLQQHGREILDGLRHGAQDLWNNTLEPWLIGLKDLAIAKFTGAYEWLQQHGSELLDGLRHGAQDLWNNTLEPWLIGLKDLAIAKFADAYDWLQDHGSDILDGLRHGAQDLWNNTLEPWLIGLKDLIIGKFPEASGWLEEHGTDILSGLLSGAQTAWDETVSPWLGGLKDKILAFFGSGQAGEVATWLVDKGADLVGGIISGAMTAWDATIAPWFGGLKDKVLAFFAGEGDEAAASWLIATGSDIIGAIIGGAQTAWDTTIVPWFGGLKDKVLAFFAGAGTWLLQVGKDIIGGIKTGAEQKWGEFENWLSEKTGGLVGTAEDAVDAKSPARKFFPVGAYMVQGIAAGAEQEMPAVESRFSRLVASIADLPLDQVFQKTRQQGGQVFNAWAQENEAYFDTLYSQVSERAGGLMEHFFLVVSQGEAHSDVIGKFHGKMRAAMVAVGEDMSDGLFSGWETYEQQFGTKITGRLQQAMKRVQRELGVSGQDINQTLSHLGQDSGERFAGGLEKGVRRGTREVEVAGPVMRTLGRNTSQSLATGFEERSSALGEAIKATVDRAISAMKTRLGIASPSRVFRWFGRMSLGGLVDGWRSQEGAFLSAVQATLSDTVGLASQYGAQMAGMSWGGPALAGAGAGYGTAPAAFSPVAAGSSAGAAPAGGGTTIHQTVIVNVQLDELEEMVEAGRFVRDLDTTRTLYLGEAG